jgi:hypothetical protein
VEAAALRSAEIAALKACSTSDEAAVSITFHHLGMVLLPHAARRIWLQL